MTQYSRKRSLSETLQQIGQQYETEMKQTVLKLVGAISEKEKVIIKLNSELDQQKQKLSADEAEIKELHDELREKQKEVDIIKEESEQQLRDQQLQHDQQLREQQQQCEQQLRDRQIQHEQQLRDQQQEHEQALAEQQVQHEEQLREEQEQYEQQSEQALAELQQQNERNLRELQERHQLEENHLQREQEQLQQQVAQLQQELQEMTDQKQQLQARVEAAFAYMRGDPGTSQVGFDAIELWEVPREDIHVSNKILGTGGWGYVAEGTFRGQKVAVKCLHRGILSQFTTNHVRREISIMAQVRHPNLVLLIGAVLNADTGPLIITELLDRSLRSAYEDHLLEDNCKVPILRDVAAALTYLHSHRRPIIHRDVSSANVLLEAVRNNSWKAKLSDFGSANLIRLATTPAEGAAPYAAPEVRTEARNQQTPKVDVYSFGMLLCEITLCQFPPDPNQFAAFLASLRDNADPRLYELAQNCTKRDPEQRPSMRDILTQIGELIPLVVA
jgi:chemotaxis protein histidine kinase CheA